MTECVLGRSQYQIRAASPHATPNQTGARRAPPRVQHRARQLAAGRARWRVTPPPFGELPARAPIRQHLPHAAVLALRAACARPPHSQIHAAHRTQHPQHAPRAYQPKPPSKRFPNLSVYAPTKVPPLEKNQSSFHSSPMPTPFPERNRRPAQRERLRPNRAPDLLHAGRLLLLQCAPHSGERSRRKQPLLQEVHQCAEVPPRWLLRSDESKFAPQLVRSARSVSQLESMNPMNQIPSCEPTFSSPLNKASEQALRFWRIPSF